MTQSETQFYIYIYGRAFCPNVTEGKEPAGACNFTKSISQTHPLGHSSASGDLAAAAADVIDEIGSEDVFKAASVHGDVCGAVWGHDRC